MVDNAFRKMITGYSLTTAEILYHLPDHHSLFQSFVWQDYDIYPHFPKLKGFCEFWDNNLDGKISRVFVAHQELIRPAEIRPASGFSILN